MKHSLFASEPLLETGKIFLEREETLAVAESVTCGFLQAAFSTVPDAARFFQGGITAYNLGQKYRHLLVEPIHAEECNCVSAQIATDMAMNVCDMFSSHWGIGITGYITPVEESGDKVFAYFSLVHKGEVVAKDVIRPERDEPVNLQLLYVDTVVSRLLKHLNKLD